MHRRTSYLLSHILASRILPIHKVAAEVWVGTLPPTLTASQSIVLEWTRHSGANEPFDFELLNNSGGNSTFTTTLSTIHNPAVDEYSQQHGELTFTIPAHSGAFELVAAKNATAPDDPRITLFNTTLSIALPTALTSIDPPNSTVTSPTNTSSAVSSSSPSGSTTPDPQPPMSSSPNPPENTSSSSSSSKTPIIIGAVIGGVVFLSFVFVLVLILLRCRRRQRDGSQEGFQRDMMILTTMDANIISESSRKEKTRVTTAEGRKLELDPISSTTPLQEDFDGVQDDRSSFTGSVYSHASAGTQTLAASGISGKSEAHSDEGSKISIPPLIPIPSSSNPPPSPLHLRTPSRARTDRQMQIEQKIIELQGRFITASGSGQEKIRTRAELKDRIERLKELRKSAWAYGGKGDVPDDLID
ncbi:hypothetical protein PM082_009488 [Marasmius tenuissimus]|nr:hypothetical protein PM082_009488 [Marasmius tenuissimus]